MTTYTTANDIIRGADTQLRKQVYGALIKIANDILNESAATNGHIVRRKWAERVRRDPSFVMQSAQVACAFDSGIRAKYDSDVTSITDSEVETVLAGALWSMIAESL